MKTEQEKTNQRTKLTYESQQNDLNIEKKWAEAQLKPTQINTKSTVKTQTNQKPTN